MDITHIWRGAVSSAKRTGGGPSSSLSTPPPPPSFYATAATFSSSSSSSSAAASANALASGPAGPSRGTVTDPFTQQAREVLESIQAKEDLLRRGKGHYVDAYRYVPSRASDMTEAERDQMEQLMASFIIKCGSQIEIIRCALAEASSLEAGGGNAGTVGGGGSRLAHYGGLVAYLAERLQDLNQTLQSLQAQRRQLGNLVPTTTTRSGASSAAAARRRLSMPPPRSPSSSASRKKVVAQSKLEVEEDELFAQRLNARAEGSNRQEQQQRRVLLEQENKALTVRLNNELEDVRMMEGKMLELSQLLGLFTGKLLEQQDQVDEIHEAAVGTHDNVGQANAELLTTLDRNSKASQTMLTFVMVLCIALLILDQVIP